MMLYDIILNIILGLYIGTFYSQQNNKYAWALVRLGIEGMLARDSPLAESPLLPTA